MPQKLKDRDTVYFPRRVSPVARRLRPRMSRTRHSSHSESESSVPNSARKPSARGPRRSPDTWVLVAGVVAALVLVAYVAHAFAASPRSAANRPTTSASTVAATPRAETVGPWASVNAKFTRLGRGIGTVAAVRVTPASLATYGARVPTIVGNPRSGTRVLISLWLKGSGASVGIEVSEFGLGSNRNLRDRVVRLTPKWHHYLVVARVTQGHWTGLGLGIYGSGEIPLGSWFAVRNLSVTLHR